MFNSPFGSIFDGGLPKSYLGQPAADSADIQEVVSGEKHAIEARAAGAPSGVVSAGQAVPQIQKIAEEMQETQSEEEITPGKDIPTQSRAALANKKPFSVLPPQFQAATTMRSEDPKVKAEQSKILVDKRERQLAAVQAEINEIKQKIVGARIYRDVLGQYSQLTGADKEAYDGWVDMHEKAIQKLSSAQKMKQKTKEARIASASITSEVKHWEALKDLKNQGVDIKGKTILKNFRPTQTSVPATPKPKGPVPKIKGKVPMDDIVRLTQGKAKSKHVQGLAATDEAVRSISNAKPQKSYKEIFIEQLPSRNLVLDQRNAKSATARLIKRTEKTMIRAKTLEWEIGTLQDQLQSTENKYRNLQEQISNIIQRIGTDPQSKKAITALGILVHAKPERFMGSPTLLKASMDAFKRLSNLGQAESTPTMTPEQEADQLLQEAANESAAAIADLETKQHALATVQAEVEGKPAPPPLSVSVALVPPAPPERSTGRKAAVFLNKILPWIAAYIVIRELFMKPKEK